MSPPSDRRAIVAVTATVMTIIALGSLLFPIISVNANTVTTLTVTPSSVFWDEATVPDDTVQADVEVDITSPGNYTIVIEWGDGESDSTSGTFASGTETFGATHAYASDAVGVILITAKLLDSLDNELDSTGETVTVEPHLTSLSITNTIPDTPWSEDITVDVLLEDDTDGVPISGADIDIGGDITVSVGPDPTDVNGETSATGASAGAPIAAGREVAADYVATLAYEAASDSVPYTQLIHVTAISINGIDDQFWGHDVTASGLVTDTTLGGTGIEGATVVVTGDITVPVAPITDETGLYSVTGASPGAPAGSRSVTADYEGLADTYAPAVVAAVAEYEALKHETEVTLTVPESKKWHEVFAASATLVDLNAASAEISLKAIEFAGDAVLTPVIASTGSPAEADLIASQNTGDQDVTATFTEDSDYLGSSDSQTMSVEKHDTAVILLSTPVTPIKWHYEFEASATLTDADASLADVSTSTPEFLDGRLLDFAGSAVHTPKSVLTGVSGLATASLEAAQDTGTESVTALFTPATAGDISLYNASPEVSSTMTIDRHATEIQELTVPLLTKWHHEFVASAKLADLDAPAAAVASPAEPTGKSILFAGSAVKTPESGTTSSPATATLTASQDTGTEIVDATFAAEPVSDGPEQNGLYYGDDASTTMTVDRHVPLVSINPASVPANQSWSMPIAPAGTFTDPESGVIATTATELGTKPISFTGTGIGTITPTATASGGGFSTSGLAPGTPCVHAEEELLICNAGLEIFANFAEEPVVDENEQTVETEEVNGLFYGNSSDAEIYDTLQHITSISPGAITINPATTTTFEFDGILFDDTFGVQLPEKVITFGGTGSTPSMIPVTTQGVTFSHPDSDGVQIVNCTTDCNTANKVLYLKSGGTITFPEETNQVTLVLDGMGTTPFDYEVNQFTGPTFTDSAIAAFPLIAQVGILNGVDDLTGEYHGISSIMITGVGPDVDNPMPGFVAIAGISTSNVEDNPVAPRFDLQFEDQVAGSSSSLALAEGSYFNNGISAAELDSDLSTGGLDPFDLVAAFDESESDPDYMSSSNSSLYFTIANTNGVAGEGTATVSAADGATITTILCGSSDADLDAICDSWDVSGGQISYTEGQSTGTYTLSTSHGTPPLSTKDDVYVELDYMAGHTPDANAIADVVAKFNAATPAVTLHVVVGESIPHVDVTNYWTDADSDSGNDFDNLKKTWFGTPAERNGVSLGAGNLALKAKAQVYRYGIYTHCIGSATGPSGTAEFKGNDLILGMGCGFTEVGGHSVGDRNEQAGTLMHELGHILGLRHGGDEDTNCMVDYRSVMSYARQLPSIKKSDGTVVPLLGANWLLDYSSVTPTPNPLNELALSETTGLASSPTYTMIWGTPTLSTKIRTALTGTNINWNGDSITGTATMDGAAKTSSVTDGSSTTYAFKMSGVKITTTGATSGSIVFTMTGTFTGGTNNDPGTISSLTAVISTVAADGPLKSSSVTAGTLVKASSGSGNTRTFTVTYPFSTTAAVTAQELGTIKVTFSGSASSRTMSTIAYASGSPLNTIQVDLNNMSDVNCPGTGTSHTPFNDWGNLSFNQRAGLTSMDGASVKGSPTGQYVSTYPNIDEKIEPDRNARQETALAAGTYSGVLSPLIEASRVDPNAVFASVNYKSTIPFKFDLRDDQGNPVTNAQKLLIAFRIGGSIDNTPDIDFVTVPLPTSQASSCNPDCLFTYQSDARYQFNLKTDQLGSKSFVAGKFWGFKFVDKTTGEVLEPTGQLFDGFSVIVYIK